MSNDSKNISPMEIGDKIVNGTFIAFIDPDFTKRADPDIVMREYKKCL